MRRRSGRRGRPTIVVAGTDGTAAALVAAAAHLDWSCRAVAGADADAVAAETGATVTGLDELVTGSGPAADVAIVAGPAERRVADTRALLHRGVPVLLVRDGLAPRAVGELGRLDPEEPPVVAMAEPFAVAPAVQAWFRRLADLGPVRHLSGLVDGSDDRPGGSGDAGLVDALVAVTSLSARVAAWGAVEAVTSPPVRASAAGGQRLELTYAGGRSVDLVVPGPRPGASSAAPRWELQAASDAHALRVEMLPVPLLELDGAPTALPPEAHPADAFGFAPLLRTFWADVTAGRRPVLDTAFAVELSRLDVAARRSRERGGRPVAPADVGLADA